MLTEIDEQIGDGDHGEGMKRGFLAVRKLLTKKSYVSIKKLCHDVSIELIRTMGGSSGVIFGTMFLGGEDILPDESRVSTEIISEYFA